MISLSIIVPIYKVDAYLAQCIESILNQSFSEFELILVDDGSPDQCAAICDSYARIDSRIKVIHQANAGVSAARNAGLRIASGEYLGFVDGDDWIEKDMYSKMMNVAKETNADIIICGMQYVGDSSRNGLVSFATEKVFTRETALEAFFALPNQIGGGCCNKIMKNNHIFYEKNIKIGEDSIFLFDNLLISENIVQIPNAFYCVRERKDSSTRNNDIDTLFLLIHSFKIIVNRTKDYSLNIQRMALNKYLDLCYQFIRFSGLDKKDLRVKTVKKNIIATLISAIKNRQLTKTMFNTSIYYLFFDS